MDLDLVFHELANIFPMMDGEEADKLVQSMTDHGFDRDEPIILYEGKILDGRNRYRAAAIADVEPVYKVFDGKDHVAFVIRKNLHRRHLNESQRALVASRLANLGDGKKKPQGAQICAPSQEEAAKALKVSRRTVQNARKVDEKGDPELVKAVEQGKVTVSDAAKVAEKPKDEQKKAVEAVVNGQAKTAAAAANAGKPKPSGKPVFDDRIIDKSIGQLIRAFDDRANSVGKCVEHKHCIEAMNQVCNRWSQWQSKN